MLQKVGLLENSYRKRALGMNTTYLHFMTLLKKFRNKKDWDNDFEINNV